MNQRRKSCSVEGFHRKRPKSRNQFVPENDNYDDDVMIASSNADGELIFRSVNSQQNHVVYEQLDECSQQLLNIKKELDAAYIQQENQQKSIESIPRIKVKQDIFESNVNHSTNSVQSTSGVLNDLKYELVDDAMILSSDDEYDPVPVSKNQHQNTFDPNDLTEYSLEQLVIKQEFIASCIEKKTQQKLIQSTPAELNHEKLQSNPKENSNRQLPNASTISCETQQKITRSNQNKSLVSCDYGDTDSENEVNNIPSANSKPRYENCHGNIDPPNVVELKAKLETFEKLYMKLQEQVDQLQGQFNKKTNESPIDNNQITEFPKQHRCSEEHKEVEKHDHSEPETNLKRKRFDLRSSNEHKRKKMSNQNTNEIINKIATPEEAIDQSSEVNKIRIANEHNYQICSTKKDAERLKNTNKDVYVGNSMDCLLCTERPHHIVNHYKKFHKDSEVFPSRLPPNIAEKVKNHLQQNKIYFRYPYKHNHHKLIKSTCYFCFDIKELSAPNWEIHYTVHTGEYMFHCSKCDEMFSYQKHDKHPQSIKKVKTHKFSQDLVAFICLDCNYVQMRRDNMIKHLRNEHEFDEKIISSKYKQFVVLPSKKHWVLSKQNAGEKSTSDDEPMQREIDNILADIRKKPPNGKLKIQKKRPTLHIKLIKCY